MERLRRAFRNPLKIDRVAEPYNTLITLFFINIDVPYAQMPEVHIRNVGVRDLGKRRPRQRIALPHCASEGSDEWPDYAAKKRRLVGWLIAVSNRERAVNLVDRVKACRLT